MPHTQPSIPQLPYLPQPLEVWERVAIVVGEPPDTGRYVTRIEDIRPDGIVVSQPEFVDGTIRLRDGASVDILLTRDDAVYRLPSVIHLGRSGGASVLLDIPRTVERVQRRQFVRIDVREPLEYTLLASGWEVLPSWAEFEWHATHTENVSGGGAFFRVRTSIEVGRLLLCKISFFDTLQLSKVIACIVRRSVVLNGIDYVGVEFLTQHALSRTLTSDQVAKLPHEITHFDRLAQNKLVNYIFQRQIDLRKRGLI